MPLFFDPLNVGMIIGGAALYWRVPRRLRAGGLAVLSWFFIAGNYPGFAAGLFLVALCFFLFQTKPISRPTQLVAGVVTGLSVLFLYKFALNPWHDWLHPSHPWRRWLVSLGASFLAFRLIQIAADRYRGLIQEIGFFDLLRFLAFFPTLGAGPLQTFQDFRTCETKGWSAELFHASVYRIAIGYFKKVVVADFFIRLFFLENFREVSLVYGFVQFLFAYADLSAYSDLAIGFAGLFGYRIPENFRFPLAATSPLDFWRRWHLSLSQFCRDQIYFPVLIRYRRSFFALLASMLVMGLWHDLTWGWLGWGLLHGSALYLNARWIRILDTIPFLREDPRAVFCLRWSGRGLTLLIVAAGYTLVSLSYSVTNLGKFQNLLVLK